MCFKACRKCTRYLTIDNFRKRNRKLKDGVIKQYNESWCLDCECKNVNEFQKNKFKKLKQDNPLEHRLYLLNHSKHNRKSKNNSIGKISDTYIAFVLGINKKYILDCPQLIEAKRAQLKLHRKANPNHRNIKQLNR